MPGDAARIHDAMVEAMEAQRRRLRGGGSEDRWSAGAERFRLDPHRPLDESLTSIASYIAADDVLLDVGGGAGRYGLPLALRCREVINVEPSHGMGEQFEASAREAGIANARWVESEWLAAPNVEGDVSLVSNVTYFVPDITAFVEKLIARSRKRVMILVLSMPSPNQVAALFRTVHGEDLALVPSYRELLPVLWEMGLLPDVRVLGLAASLGGNPAFPSRDAAIDAALAQFRPAGDAAARERIDANFDALFRPVADGFQRRLQDQTMILITWPTR